MNKKEPDNENIGDEMFMERRTFLKNSALAALFVGMTVYITGCEDGGSSSEEDNGNAQPVDSTGQSSSTGGQQQTFSNVSATIGINPEGHTATVTGAQQQAGQAVTITLTSGAGHTHNVSLSAADVQAIAAGSTIVKQSTMSLGHTHTVTFN